MQKTREGFTVWLTGLSGAGKSTIGMLLANELKNRGMNVEFLDGDEVRAELCQDLGFSPKDRLTNIQRVCYVTELLNRNGISVVASFITPYHSMREYCRVRIRNYTEVYVKCPLETLIQRDGKGLYKKALTGCRMFTKSRKAPISSSEPTLWRREKAWIGSW